MGEILAREAPVEADLVIAVPDSGNAAARGYARASGLPQDDGFVKNRYVARTFIQPGQELRKHGLRLKFNPLPEIVGGKRLVVVDDSIVRGNTTRQIVQMLRDAGAREVHMRISAPPIKHPCHYGIDMSTREEMIAHGRTPERGRRGAGLRLARATSRSTASTRRSAATRARHCDACFSGEYPLDGTRGRERQVRARARAAARAGLSAPGRHARASAPGTATFASAGSGSSRASASAQAVLDARRAPIARCPTRRVYDDPARACRSTSWARSSTPVQAWCVWVQPGHDDARAARARRAA